MQNLREATNQFSEAIRATGMSPPDVIEPGKIHRFSDNGDHNKDGWCKFFFNPDGSAGGAFGNWKGIHETWFSGNGSQVNHEQREQLRRQIEQARQKAEAVRKEEQGRAAKKAQRIWAESKPSHPEHPYLKAKTVKPYNIRQSGKALVVPVYGHDRAIKSLQFIYPDGKKRFLKGAEKKGCFGVIGNLKDAERAYLCEGYATGATVHEATGIPVILAFDAGNLKPVCQTIKQLMPDLEIIIAGDDDMNKEGNPGRTKAEEAARAFNLSVALPDVSGDFNDLISRDGKSFEDVREQLEQTYRPIKEEPETEEANNIFSKSPFPENVLPPTILTSLQQLARACASSFTSLPGAAISIFSSLIGSTVSVSPKLSWEEPLIFWVCDIRPSGSGKTPAARNLCNVLYAAQREADEDYQLQKDLWDSLPKEDRGQPPERARGYFVTDLTLEGIRVDHSGHGGKVCIFDELSAFLSSQNQYKASKGSDRESWLNLHDGKPARIVRARESVTLSGSRVSIFGGIQPEVWRSSFSGNDGGIYLTDGTVFRFLPTFEGDGFRPLTAEAWSDDNRHAWENLLRKAMGWANNADEKKVLCLSRESQKLFFSWRNELVQMKDDLPPAVRGFIPKLVGYALRFSGALYLMHAFANAEGVGNVLSIQDIQRGIDLSEFYLGHIIQAMGALKDGREPATEMTEQTLHLATVLKGLEPEIDSGRLAVGYIREKFNEACQEGLGVKTPHRMGAILRKCGLTILSGNHAFHGKGGMKCLSWDEKTKLFIEQSHRSHSCHRREENQAVTGYDFISSKSQLSQNQEKAVTSVTSEIQSQNSEHVEIIENCDNCDNRDLSPSENRKTSFEEGTI